MRPARHTRRHLVARNRPARDQISSIKNATTRCFEASWRCLRTIGAYIGMQKHHAPDKDIVGQISEGQKSRRMAPLGLIPAIGFCQQEFLPVPGDRSSERTEENPAAQARKIFAAGVNTVRKSHQFFYYLLWCFVYALQNIRNKSGFLIYGLRSSGEALLFTK